MDIPVQTVTLLSPLRRLLRDHQIFCAAHCCKEQAFGLTEGSITRWLDFERADRSREIAAEIDRVASDVQCAAGRIWLDSPGLESGWGADEFRAFWGRLQTTYARAVEAHERAGT